MPDKKRNDDASGSGRDRRTATRFRTRALTDGSFVSEVPKGGHSFLGTTVNVSTGGVLVRTYEALSAGQEVSLTMHLPEGDLRVIGTVLHVEQDAVGCRLAGVRFASLPSDQGDLLKRHLHSFDARTARPKGGGSKPALRSLSERNPDAEAQKAPISAVTADDVRASAGGARPEESGAAGDGARKSLRELRHRETVVWPFEGQIHRG